MSDYMIPITMSDVEKDTVQAIKDYLGEDIQHLHHFPERIMVNFVYCEDFIWLPLFTLDVEQLKNMRLKEMIQQKRKEIKQLLKEKDFDTLLSITEKAIKISMYVKYFQEIPDEKKYDLFQKVYVSSEYNFSFLEEEFLQEVFSYRHLSSKWKERISQLREKADQDGMLTLYRGEGSKSTPLEYALSWTIESQVAHFFAHRFDKDGIIWKVQAHIEDVLDYFNNRNEEEVLIRFEDVKNVEQLS